MHDLRTIFRNSLLFCAIAADFCFISLAHADRSVMYTVPYRGSVYGVVPKNAAAAEAMEQWSVNSRKVRTIGYGAAASATASRSSYGFIGRMTVSRAFFQAWLAYEVGSIGLEWIRQQYAEMPNATFDPASLHYLQELPTKKYTCVAATSNRCFFAPLNHSEILFDNSSDAFTYDINNICIVSNCNIVVSNVKYYDDSPYYDIRADYTAYNNDGEIIARGTAGVIGQSQLLPIVENTTLKQKIPAGEPTLEPDPYLTAAILDRWAHIVPEMRARVSDTVDFVPSKARYTEKDVLGNVLKDYEGVLEPMEEPIANPHKTAKRPAPEIEPTPRLKTTDLLNGNEITQPTEPIKEPTSETTTQTTPKIEVDIDLSKLEQTTASIDSKIQPLENQEVTYEADNAEIEAPDDLTAQEAETAVVGRLKVPHLEPEKLVDAAFNAAGDFTVHDILDDKTSSCPPPRTLTIIGGARVQMPFDPLCEFLAMIKKIFVPVVGWIIFLMWVRRIGSS